MTLLFSMTLRDSIVSTGTKKVWLFWHLNLMEFLPLQILKLVERHSPLYFLASKELLSRIWSLDRIVLTLSASWELDPAICGELKVGLASTESGGKSLERSGLQ